MEGQQPPKEALPVTSVEKFTVECPTCGKGYVYDVAVTYSEVSFADIPKPQTLRRLFNCPKDGMFEAPITVAPSATEVSVKGLHTRNGDAS